MAKMYNHPFTDGDIIADEEFKEVFTFTDRSDGFRAEKNPTKLRLATKEEKQKLIDSKETCISL